MTLFVRQPAPPPMPPEWNERLWEQRKRELAEERRRRQVQLFQVRTIWDVLVYLSVCICEYIYIYTYVCVCVSCVCHEAFVLFLISSWIFSIFSPQIYLKAGCDERLVLDFFLCSFHASHCGAACLQMCHQHGALLWKDGQLNESTLDRSISWVKVLPFHP